MKINWDLFGMNRREKIFLWLFIYVLVLQAVTIGMVVNLYHEVLQFEDSYFHSAVLQKRVIEKLQENEQANQANKSESHN